MDMMMGDCRSLTGDGYQFCWHPLVAACMRWCPDGLYVVQAGATCQVGYGSEGALCPSRVCLWNSTSPSFGNGTLTSVLSARSRLACQGASRWALYDPLFIHVFIMCLTGT